jgi:hypothetical protein
VLLDSPPEVGTPPIPLGPWLSAIAGGGWWHSDIYVILSVDFDYLPAAFSLMVDDFMEARPAARPGRA